MHFPTEVMLLSTAKQNYQKWKLPNCIGAVDGKHILIKCPAKSGSSYFNYKKYFPIVLQGLVDVQYKFINVEAGTYGKQSDGGIFTSSSVPPSRTK